MTTTTIRIDDELKARVSAAAKHSGKTTHAFILDAISNTVERAESARDFTEVADDRWSKILESGETIAWSEMRNYLNSKKDGGIASPPKARVKRR